MNLASLLALVGLRSGRVASPQTLAAANRRQRESLAEARARIEALPAGAERFRLEAAAERLRMRVELFRTDKLSAGVGIVNAASTSRSGDSLTALGADVAELLRAVESAEAPAETT